MQETSRTRRARMEAVLRSEFAPERLEVIDESEAHRNHGGWREGGETHFRVVMRASAFLGMTRIERSRAVQGALADEFQSGLHALALELSAP